VFIILNITPFAPFDVPTLENKLDSVGEAFVLPFMAIVCPEHKLKSEPAFAVGAAINAPLTAAFTEDAPVLLQTILAAVGFEAKAFILTYISVLDTVPPAGVSDTLDAQPEPEVVDTLKPVGAVMTMFPVKYNPDTEKDCCALATLGQAEKAFKVPDCDTVGEGAAVVKLRVVQPVVTAPALFFGTILQ
jgi:hypothetical protein